MGKAENLHQLSADDDNDDDDGEDIFKKLMMRMMMMMMMMMMMVMMMTMMMMMTTMMDYSHRVHVGVKNFRYCVGFVHRYMNHCKEIKKSNETHIRLRVNNFS